MLLTTAGTLALGATAGMMLEQRFGAVVLRWLRRRFDRCERSDCADRSVRSEDRRR
jgi:hypothetical protein